MNVGLLESVLNAVHIAVFVKEEPYWKPLGELPGWFHVLLGTDSLSPMGATFENSEFLSFFISECEEHWRSKSPHVKLSSIFNDQSFSKNDYSFEAMAITVEEQRVLVIKRQDKTQQELASLYQKGREGELAKEALEKVQKELIASKTQIEQLLGQLETKHETVLSLLSELETGALVVDQNGGIDFASPLAIDFLGVPSHLLTHVENIVTGGLNLIWKELVESGTGKREIEFPDANDLKRYLEIEVKPYPQSDSKYILFLYNVTELRLLRNRIQHEFQFSPFETQNPAMRGVHKVIQDVAPTNWTVLIQGETGTGKEVTARAIHNASSRSHMPFLAVNCAGLPDALLQSELFGHKKGSFTGAIHDHIGLFEAANGGTLFLDEIGDVTMNMQQSLLRVLEEKTIKRVGDVQERPIDVRIIAATHKDLVSDVSAGKFRSDLFFRLRVGRVQLPPLRQRQEDIEKFAQHFLRESALAVNKKIYGFERNAMHALKDYGWPGNIRELRSAIEYVSMHISGEKVELSDLPPEIVKKSSKGIFPFAGHGSLSTSPLEDTREGLLVALKTYRGNRSRAAKALQLSRATFYRRLKEYGLE